MTAPEPKSNTPTVPLAMFRVVPKKPWTAPLAIFPDWTLPEDKVAPPPLNPLIPLNPEIPEKPLIPENPETPLTPEKPLIPENPD
jgi:hypothetical protein